MPSQRHRGLLNLCRHFIGHSDVQYEVPRSDLGCTEQDQLFLIESMREEIRSLRDQVANPRHSSNPHPRTILLVLRDEPSGGCLQNLRQDMVVDFLTQECARHRRERDDMERQLAEFAASITANGGASPHAPSPDDDDDDDVRMDLLKPGSSEYIVVRGEVLDSIRSVHGVTSFMVSTGRHLAHRVLRCCLLRALLLAPTAGADRQMAAERASRCRRPDQRVHMRECARALTEVCCCAADLVDCSGARRRAGEGVRGVGREGRILTFPSSEALLWLAKVSDTMPITHAFL
eukprot:598926-Rhodomonas_salina.4